MKAYPLMMSVAAMLALAGCGGPPQDDAAVQLPDPAVKAAVASAPPANPSVGVKQPSIVEGSVAPDFELPGSDGKTHKLSDFAGRHVVLAFFPKAFTGG